MSLNRGLRCSRSALQLIGNQILHCNPWCVVCHWLAGPRRRPQALPCRTGKRCAKRFADQTIPASLHFNRNRNPVIDRPRCDVNSAMVTSILAITGSHISKAEMCGQENREWRRRADRYDSNACRRRSPCPVETLTRAHGISPEPRRGYSRMARKRASRLKGQGDGLAKKHPCFLDPRSIGECRQESPCGRRWHRLKSFRSVAAAGSLNPCARAWWMSRGLAGFAMTRGVSFEGFFTHILNPCLH